jgi:hypothetical protein
MMVSRDGGWGGYTHRDEHSQSFSDAPTAVTTIGYTPSATATPSSTETSDSSETTAPDSDAKESSPATSTPKSSKSKHSDTVAIAVGVSVGIAGIIAVSVIGFLLFRRRKSSASSLSSSSPPWQVSSYPPTRGVGGAPFSPDDFMAEESYKGFGSANAAEHVAGLEVVELGSQQHHQHQMYQQQQHHLQSQYSIQRHQSPVQHLQRTPSTPAASTMMSSATAAWATPAPVSAMAATPTGVFSSPAASAANAALRSPSLPNVHSHTHALAVQAGAFVPHDTPAPPYSAVAAENETSSPGGAGSPAGGGGARTGATSPKPEMM